MSRHHISPNGNPMPCGANKGNCPFVTEHFDSKEEAEKYISQKSEQEYGLIKSLRKPSKRDSLLKPSTAYSEDIHANKGPGQTSIRSRPSKMTSALTAEELPSSSEMGKTPTASDKEKYKMHLLEYSNSPIGSSLGKSMDNLYRAIDNERSFDDIQKAIKYHENLINHYDKKFDFYTSTIPKVSAKNTRKGTEVTIKVNDEKSITFLTQKENPEKTEKLSKVSQIGKKVNKLESQFKEYQKSKEQKGEKVDPEIAKSVAEKIQEGRLKSKALMQEIETISEFERQNKAFNNSMSEIDNAKIDETELNLFRDSKSLEY